MDEKKHHEIMGNILQLLEEDGLTLNDAVSIWHSFGSFLLTNIDENTSSTTSLHTTMKICLDAIKDMENETK